MDDELNNMGKSYSSVDELVQELEDSMTTWDKVKRATWWKLLNWISNKWYKCRKIYQRITKGRADEEIWELSTHILRYVTPRLVEFQKSERFGYPYNGADINSKEDWETILDKMVEAFTLCLKDEDTTENIYYNYDTKEFDKEKYLEFNSKLEEGFTLFGKYFTALWD